MKIALLGFGTVGSHFYKLCERRTDLHVAAVLSRRPRPELTCTVTADYDEIVRDPFIDIVVEVMGGIEPAYSYLCAAMRAGKHVVTANKQLMCARFDSLTALSKEMGVALRCTAAAGGGIPWLTSLSRASQLDEITAVEGILNGTTNYILTRMANEGAAYADVLADAQRLGLAEPDPTADVEGYDAAYKLSILSTLAFHRHVPVENVYREGITGITPLDVQCGKEFGLTLKLLAVAKEENGEIQARVHPTFVPNSHPLANVNDAFNAVFVKGHACGEMMFYGRGAGDLPTASALVSDLICAAKAKRHELPAVSEAPCRMAEDWRCVHFVRMRAKDEPGVLSLITGGFAAEGVSIASMVQKGERDEAGFVRLIFLTHRAGEHAVRRALAKMDPAQASAESVIRVEE